MNEQDKKIITDFVGLLRRYWEEDRLRYGPKTDVLIRAFGCLPAKSVKEVVKAANSILPAGNKNRITVTEFKNWLPEFLSDVFADYIQPVEKAANEP